MYLKDLCRRPDLEMMAVEASIAETLLDSLP
jgi:hypothetical protein